MAGDRIVVSRPRLGTRRRPVPDRRRGHGRRRASPTGRSSPSIIPEPGWASAAQGIAWQQLASEDVELLTTRPERDRALLPLATRSRARVPRRAPGSSYRLQAAAGRSIPRLRCFATPPASRDGWRRRRAAAPSRCSRPMCCSQAGTLESTMRHELLHMLIESHASRARRCGFAKGWCCICRSPRLASKQGIGIRKRASELEKAMSDPAQ